MRSAKDEAIQEAIERLGTAGLACDSIVNEPEKISFNAVRAANIRKQIAVVIACLTNALAVEHPLTVAKVMQNVNEPASKE